MYKVLMYLVNENIDISWAVPGIKYRAVHKLAFQCGNLPGRFATPSFQTGLCCS